MIQLCTWHCERAMNLHRILGRQLSRRSFITSNRWPRPQLCSKLLILDPRRHHSSHKRKDNEFLLNVKNIEINQKRNNEAEGQRSNRNNHNGYERGKKQSGDFHYKQNYKRRNNNSSNGEGGPRMGQYHHKFSDRFPKSEAGQRNAQPPTQQQQQRHQKQQNYQPLNRNKPIRQQGENQQFANRTGQYQKGRPKDASQSADALGQGTTQSDLFNKFRSTKIKENDFSVESSLDIDESDGFTQNGNRRRKQAKQREKYTVNVNEPSDMTEANELKDRLKQLEMSKKFATNIRATKPKDPLVENPSIPQAKTIKRYKPALKPQIVVPANITVANFSSILRVDLHKFMDSLENFGFSDVLPDKILTSEECNLIAEELNFEIKKTSTVSHNLVPAPEPEDKSHWTPRPPVVTIMGHVDHGKTSLLDRIRSTNVVQSEAGRITQQIGAFKTEIPDSLAGSITFIDTPGHAAFEAMRKRGADVTDIAVLVVAADDGIKDQTIEAIKHIKNAKASMIVAITKSDLPTADPTTIMSDLHEHGVDVEDIGGEVQCITLSSKTGEGIEELKDAIVSLAELKELKSDATEPICEGFVLESAKDSFLGPVATILVRRGTVRKGSILVSGTSWCRIRKIQDENGVDLAQVEPGNAARVSVWSAPLPTAGDSFILAKDERIAKLCVKERAELQENEAITEHIIKLNVERKLQHELSQKSKEEALNDKKKTSEQVDEQVEENAANTKDTKDKQPLALNIVLRADTNGSLEALIESINKLGRRKARPVIISAEVGNIAQTDVKDAHTYNAKILGFNTNFADHEVQAQAQQSKVDIFTYKVIYPLIDKVQELLCSTLPPIEEHKILGVAEVLKIFDVNIIRRKIKRCAGSRIISGRIHSNDTVKLVKSTTRDNNKAEWEDEQIETLQHLKDKVNEILQGKECGIILKNREDFEVGDRIIAYKKEYRDAKLDDLD